MVFYRNILELYREMRDDEVLRLGFTSGKSINCILKSDKVFIMNDDVVIERINRKGRCKVVIDPATVETVNIITKNGVE